MEQIRSLKDIIHKDGVHKAGHIFNVPDDVDLVTARRWVDKKMATDSIEVLEEAEVVEVIDPADVLAESAVDAEPDAALDAAVDIEPDDEPGEEVTELGDDTPEDDGEGEAGEEDISCETVECESHTAEDDTCGHPEGPDGCDNRTKADDISTLTKKELKAKLKDRSLPTSGNKEEMHERLSDAIEADNATDGTDGSEEAGAGEAGEE